MERKGSEQLDRNTLIKAVSNIRRLGTYTVGSGQVGYGASSRSERVLMASAKGYARLSSRVIAIDFIFPLYDLLNES